MVYFRLKSLSHRGLFNRNRQALLVASYSRNSSNSKNSPYKVVTAKIKSKFLKNFVIQKLKLRIFLH